MRNLLFAIYPRFCAAANKHAGNRERGDGSLQIGDGPVESGDVQRFACMPGGIVTTAEPDARIAPQCFGDTGPGRRPAVEADEHQANPSALPFDQSVGGQRSGERDERNGGATDAGPLEHRLGGAADARAARYRLPVSVRYP